MTDYMEHPDYDTVVDALCEGIKSSTKLTIDSLGITVELSTLPSWNEYAELKRKMYHEFTSTWSYRFLFPQHYRKLYRAYIDAQLRVQDELLERVLDKANGSKEP